MYKYNGSIASLGSILTLIMGYFTYRHFIKYNSQLFKTIFSETNAIKQFNSILKLKVDSADQSLIIEGLQACWWQNLTVVPNTTQPNPDFILTLCLKTYILVTDLRGVFRVCFESKLLTKKLISVDLANILVIVLTINHMYIFFIYREDMMF